jgi:hypothetical protein
MISVWRTAGLSPSMPTRPPTHAQLLRRACGRSGEDRDYDQRRRERDPALAFAARVYRSNRWQNLRALQLSREPLCEDCRRHGSHAVELTYKDPSGKVANELLYRDDEPRIEIVEAGRPWSPQQSPSRDCAPSPRCPSRSPCPARAAS